MKNESLTVLFILSQALCFGRACLFSHGVFLLWFWETARIRVVQAFFYRILVVILSLWGFWSVLFFPSFSLVSVSILFRFIRQAAVHCTSRSKKQIHMMIFVFLLLIRYRLSVFRQVEHDSGITLVLARFSQCTYSNNNQRYIMPISSSISIILFFLVCGRWKGRISAIKTRISYNRNKSWEQGGCQEACMMASFWTSWCTLTLYRLWTT